MIPQKITNIIICLLMSIVSFFIVDLHNRLSSVEKIATQNRQLIELQSQKTDLKFERLEEKIDELKDAINDLTTELQTRKQNR